MSERCARNLQSIVNFRLQRACEERLTQRATSPLAVPSLLHLCCEESEVLAGTSTDLRWVLTRWYVYRSSSTR